MGRDDDVAFTCAEGAAQEHVKVGVNLVSEGEGPYLALDCRADNKSGRPLRKEWRRILLL